jgi:hypothetical protein
MKGGLRVRASRAATLIDSKPPRVGSTPVKKGRHRRFEEARALKRSDSGIDISDIFGEAPPAPCEECDAAPGAEHASWCLADADEP